jgi:hypothetical protein
MAFLHEHFINTAARELTKEGTLELSRYHTEEVILEFLWGLVCCCKFLRAGYER